MTGKTGIVALSLMIAGPGCGAEPTPTTPARARPARAAASVAASASASAGPGRPESARRWDPDPELRWQLEKDAIYSCCVGRRILYTWTTSAQIAELRQTKLLLSRTESPTKGKSRFDLLLEASQAPASRLLRQPGLSRRRFGWSNPWATLLGWGEAETYGAELVRVTLREGALIGIFDASLPEPWRFADLDNNPVAMDQALSTPERIAAVYHVWRPSPGDKQGLAYREYVLVNESMIQQWAYGTPDLALRMVQDTGAITKLRNLIKEGQLSPGEPSDIEFNRMVTTSIWPQSMERAPLPVVFGAGLAFPNRAYLLRAEALDKLVAALNAVAPQGGQLVHHPSMGFDLAVSPTPPKPPPKPRPCSSGGTFGCY
jgi:hypothetical protein